MMVLMKLAYHLMKVSYYFVTHIKNKPWEFVADNKRTQSKSKLHFQLLQNSMLTLGVRQKFKGARWNNG
jgi:hypothetical protein